VGSGAEFRGKATYLRYGINTAVILRTRHINHIVEQSATATDGDIKAIRVAKDSSKATVSR
jgi:hypothetical protein